MTKEEKDFVKEQIKHNFERYDYEMDGLGCITDEYFLCECCGTIRHYDRVDETVKDFKLTNNKK